MKKRALIIFNIIMAIIIFIFLCLNTKILNSEFYLAKSKLLYNNNDFNFDFVVNPEFTKTKAGETVKIKLSLQDINMGEQGLNNVVGYLKYDESVYESVEIKGINGWEFNQNTDKSHSMFGKFVIHKMEESVKNNEDVAELILKLKSDLKPQTTELNFTKLQSSNGDNLVLEKDKKAVIEIVEEDVVIPDEPKQGEEEPKVPEVPVKIDSKVIKTGDNLVFPVLSLILATIALNIIILKKNKLKSNNSGVKVGIISACGIIVVALTMLCITTFAHSEEITKLINSLDYKETWLNSEKYLVTDESISRVAPLTNINDFKDKFNKNIELYEDGNKVIDGLVKTNMTVLDKDIKYGLSVVGDVNGDGESDCVDLTSIIREVVNASKWGFGKEQKQAIDMNVDGEENEKDVETSVRYILYGELNIPSFDKVKEPKIEVVGGKFNNVIDAYEDTIKIKISKQDENAVSTMYKIDGTRTKGYMKIDEDEVVELSENGVYKISAYNYGVAGNRSEIPYIIVVKRSANSDYVIEYYYEEQGQYKDKCDEKKNKKGETDTVVSVGDEDKEPSKSGYKFDESKNGNLSGKVTEDGSLVLKVYFKQKFKVSYLAGEHGTFEKQSTEGLNYNEETPDFKGELTHEEGYVFDGWDKNIEPRVKKDVEYVAKWKEQEYSIVYGLDGGTLGKDNSGAEIVNPSVYTISTETFKLNNPSKPGYVFEGWTGTGLNDKTMDVVIKKGSTGNRAYTANWKEIDFSYKIEYYYDDVKDESKTETQKAKYKQVISTFTDKCITGYELKETPKSITISYDESKNIIRVDYIKKSYKLILQKDDNIESVSGEGTYKYKENVQISATLKQIPGYTITWNGWKSLMQNLIQDKVNKTENIIIPAGDVTLKATTNKQAINYNIQYNLNGGIIEQGKENVTSYTIETPDIILNNPIKQGYVFSGWTGGTQEKNYGTSGNIVNPTKDVIIKKGSMGDRFYTANWIGDSKTVYKVEHYKEKLDGTYELAESENLEGTTDTKVTAVKKTYQGFYFDENNENNILQGNVKPDGSLVLKVYYKRNQYTLKLVAGENINSVNFANKDRLDITTVSGISIDGMNFSNETPEKTKQIQAKFKFGSQVNISAVVGNEVGYTITWDKWESSDNEVLVNQTLQDTVVEIPMQDITLTAKATKKANTYGYKIEYYYDNVKDESKTESKTAEFGTVISTYTNNNRTGYELEKAENKPLTITENETNNIMKIYYKQITYTINYNLNDGKLSTGKTNVKSYKVNTETFTLNNPEKIGYTFSGWTGGVVDDKGDIINNPTVNQTGTSGNITSPTETVKIEKGSIGNRKYNANWKPNANTAYKIEHYIEKLESIEETDVNLNNYVLYKIQGEDGSLVGTTGEKVTASPIEILGFTYNAEKSAKTISGTISADGTLVLKVFYTRNSYKLNLVAGENIDKVVNNGDSSETSIEKTYKFEENVKISASLKKITGYTTNWKNWTSNNVDLIPNLSIAGTTIKIPAGNVTLTANAEKVKAKFAYKVEYYYDNEKNENETDIKEPVEYESTITNYEDKLKNGFEFDKAENLPLTIGANEDKNIIKIFYKLKNYSISYDLQNGKLADGETNKTIYNLKTADIVVNNPTRSGFLFKGWTGGVVNENDEIIVNPTKEQTGTTGNVQNPTKSLKIEKGSIGNRKYIANWEERAYEVIVHHYLEGTGPKFNNEPVILAEDEIFTSKVLGEKYTTDDLIPTYDENGNIIETDERNYLDGKEFYVSGNSGNTTGTYTEDTIEITYYYQHYPVIRIVSSPVEELNGTEYITIKEAIQALENANQTVENGTSKLEILRNVKDESVLIENKNIEIDLAGFTINSCDETDSTINLNNSKLTVVDNSEVQTGKIISENGVAIHVKNDSEFTLGLEEKPVKPTPEIIAKTKGVEKEIVDNKQGIFNFFDGKITAANAIDGIVDLTPILYSATVTTNEQGQQLSVLQIVSNVEARIGRKTYLKLEDAIADVGTEYGTDGSQVEVTVVKDLTKDKEVVIDSSKNVLLDLNGCLVTTTGSNYVFNNNGKLEIIDRTSQDIIKIDSLTPNGTYYFKKNEDGSFTSNNKGASGVANSYATIDLTEYEGTYILSLQAEICGYSNYGYATITQTTNAPAYNATSGRLVYMTNIVGREYFEEELQGGSVYYLHLGYKKDDDSKLFDDEFKVNDIKVIKKTTGKVSPGTAGSIKNSSTGEFVLTSGNLTPSSLGAVENYGTCRINGGRIVGNNYGVVNKDSGNLIVNGGLIKTSRSYAISTWGKNTVIEGGIIQSDNTTISISNNGSAKNLVINNGTISSTNGKCINNYSTNPVIINNGYVGGSDTCIYSIGNLEINGGNFKSTKIIFYGHESNININNANTVGGILLNTYSGIININNINARVTQRGINDAWTPTINIIGGKIEVNNISGTAYGIYSESNGNYNITNAEIDVYGKETYGIYSEKTTGKIDIGLKDGNIENNSVIIKSMNGPCINAESKTVNYYDGTLIGNVNYKTISSSITQIEDNCDLIIEEKEDKLRYITLGIPENPVAKIAKSDTIVGSLYESSDENYYYFNTLKSALDSCNPEATSQTTIYITAPILNTAKSYTITEKQNVKIELNGNKISAFNKYFIQNNGKLEISDNTKTTDEQGEVVSGTGEINTVGQNLINNSGELILNGGTYSSLVGGNNSYYKNIENTGSLTANDAIIKSNHGTYGIYNNSEQDILISGGKFSCTGKNSYNVYNASASKIILNETILEGEYCNICNESTGSISLNKVSMKSLMRYAKNVSNKSSGKVEINDSTLLITGQSNINIVNESSNGGEIVVINSNLLCEGSYSANINNTGSGTITIQGGKVTNGEDINNHAVINFKDTTVVEGVSNYSGTVNIENSDITGSVRNFGNINMVSGTIQSNNGAIIQYNNNNDNPNINIKGGSIISTYGSAIYATVGKVTLGEKGGIPSKTEPSISGKTYGIEMTGGTLYFYDGIVEGSVTNNEGMSIKGAVADQEEGYEIIKTKTATRETAVLDKLPVAKVVSTGTEYDSLQSAIDAVTDNTEDSIELVRNVIISSNTESTVIGGNKKVVLDLKGYTIQSSNKNTIINNGTLEIISTARTEKAEGAEEENIVANAGTGKIINTAGNAINNTGTLNITSGTMQLNASGTSLIENSGTLNINGGTLISNGNESIVINNTNVLTINSGTITNNSGNGTHIKNTGTVTLNDGTIKGDVPGYGNVQLYGITGGDVYINGGSIYVDSYGNTYGVKTNGIVKMTGGTVTALSNPMYGYSIYLEDSETEGIELTGGTINSYTREGAVYNLNTKEITISNTINGTVVNESNGTINIVGEANINTGEGYYGQSAIRNSNSGTINVDGDNVVIKSNYYGIENTSSGVINMKKGTIQATLYCSSSGGQNKVGIYNKSTGKVNIEDGNVISSMNGIINLSGTLDYYGGTITGEFGIKGTITNIPSGKNVVLTKSETTETYTLDNTSEVASITINDITTNYNTLNEAINAAEDLKQTTVKLLKDIVIDSENVVTVRENKDIVLDLNGKEIRCHTNDGDIINNGKLEIIDSTEYSSGKIYGFGSKIIKNTSQFILTSGKIYAEADRTQIILYNTGAGNVTMNGGLIQSIINLTYYVTTYNLYSDSIGEVNLNGGEINYSGYASNYCVYIKNTDAENIAILNCNGTNINCNGTSNSGKYNAIYMSENGKVTISGGDISSSRGYVIEIHSNTKISGGNIEGGTCSLYENADISGGTINISSFNCYKELEISDNAIINGNLSLQGDTNIKGGNINGRVFTYGNKFNMYSGNITSSSNAIQATVNSKPAEINIYGGTVEGTNSSYSTIELDYGNNITIYGGTIKGNGIGIYAKRYSNITIGQKTYPVSITTPEIIGGTYGLYLTGSGKCNFYDGIIKGSTKAIYGKPTDYPEFYSLVLSEDEKVATLGISGTFEQVAVMNGIYYDSLQEAINATGTAESTITLEKDIVLTNGIIIEPNQNITIDLSGHLIRIPTEDYAITNNGRLAIIDTQIQDEGTTVESKVESYLGTGIYNSKSGVLVIGIDDGSVNNQVPIIKGALYGIENNGKLSVFDGCVKGEESPVGGVQVQIEVPSGYTVETVEETIENKTIKCLRLIAK